MTTESTDADAVPPQDATPIRIVRDESPSMAVVRAVADASGRCPSGTGEAGEALDPIAESIDPDALDRLFDARNGAPDVPPVAEFRYCGYEVTVRGGEAVSVTVQ